MVSSDILKILASFLVPCDIAGMFGMGIDIFIKRSLSDIHHRCSTIRCDLSILYGFEPESEFHYILLYPNDVFYVINDFNKYPYACVLSPLLHKLMLSISMHPIPNSMQGIPITPGNTPNIWATVKHGGIPYWIERDVPEFGKVTIQLQGYTMKRYMF